MSLNIKKKLIKFPGDCRYCDHWGAYDSGTTGWCEHHKDSRYPTDSCGKFKPREDKPEEPDRSMTLTEVHAWCDENLTGFDCLHCGKCCVHPGCNGEEKKLINDFLYKHEIKPVDNGTEICPFRHHARCLIWPVRPVMCRAIGYHEKEGTCKNRQCENCEMLHESASMAILSGALTPGNCLSDAHAEPNEEGFIAIERCDICGGTGVRPNPNIDIKGKWGQLLRLYKACGGELYMLHGILLKGE